ncbi:hypothetical protein KBI31_00140 [Patescibacteria group bacterium]|nr:hypothetical protein [Patescibacteria group bacterium]
MMVGRWSSRKILHYFPSLTAEQESLLSGQPYFIHPCLLLKIADRQHNFSTISHLPSNKQGRMAFETQAPLLPMKEILDYDRKGLTISEAAANWQQFLDKGHFFSLSVLKEELYKKQFVDLDSTMYNDHANAIIWQLTDKFVKAMCIIVCK